MKPNKTFAEWFSSAQWKSKEVKAAARRFAAKKKIEKKKAA